MSQFQQPICTPEIFLVYVTNVLKIKFFPLLLCWPVLLIFHQEEQRKSSSHCWHHLGVQKDSDRVKATNLCKNGWCEYSVSILLCFIQCREMHLWSGISTYFNSLSHWFPSETPAKEKVYSLPFFHSAYKALSRISLLSSSSLSPLSIIVVLLTDSAKLPFFHFVSLPIMAKAWSLFQEVPQCSEMTLY